MQNKFTEHVATITGLTPAQHSVLKVIAGFTDHNTGEAFPSLGTIAAGADVARSTVQIAINDLCEAGHLEFVRQRKTPRGHVNVYRVTIPGTIPTHHTDFHHTDTDDHTEVAHHTDGFGMVESVDSRTNPPYRQNHVGNELFNTSLPIPVNRKDQNLNRTDRLPVPWASRKFGDNVLVPNDPWFNGRATNYLDNECAMGVACRCKTDDWGTPKQGEAFCEDCKREHPVAERNATLREVEAWVQTNLDYCKEWKQRVKAYKQSDEYKARV